MAKKKGRKRRRKREREREKERGRGKRKKKNKKLGFMQGLTFLKKTCTRPHRSPYTLLMCAVSLSHICPEP